MDKPQVVILSHLPLFLSDVASALHSHASVFACETLLEARDVAATRTPTVFLLDASAAGGREDDEHARFIQELRFRLPDVVILGVYHSGSHPKIESVAGAAGVVQIPPGTTVTDIVDRIRSAISPPETTVKKPSAAVNRISGVSRDTESDTVLSGITRQFETNTPQLKQMLARLEVAARHNVTILLIGETGSGKTYISRLIHEVSPRCNEPFLHVACGALPSELIESELFGHNKGSFTSAHADKQGKFVAAGAGTVLLDEIDVLGMEQQVKLLKVIETGEFEPVGSNITLTSQARLVVASNLDLQPLVEENRFRPDLYYRLNTLKFVIPPLRDRQPDIAPLARKFVRQHAERHSLEITQIDPDFIEALHNYPWPGNVRELENAIQSAVIYCEDGVLRADNLPPNIVAQEAGPSNDPSVARFHPRSRHKSLGSRMQLTEREIIEQALLNNNFSRTNTAKDLGISRVTLYNKMKKYGMLE